MDTQYLLHPSPGQALHQVCPRCPLAGKQAAAVRHRDPAAAPWQPWGPWGPLSVPASKVPAPWRAGPHLFPLSLASEQSRLCVQGWRSSLMPPRANTSSKPQAQPGPRRQLLAGSSCWGRPRPPCAFLTSASTQFRLQCTPNAHRQPGKQLAQSSWLGTLALPPALGQRRLGIGQGLYTAALVKV